MGTIEDLKFIMSTVKDALIEKRPDAAREILERTNLNDFDIEAALRNPEVGECIIMAGDSDNIGSVFPDIGSVFPDTISLNQHQTDLIIEYNIHELIQRKISSFKNDDRYIRSYECILRANDLFNHVINSRKPKPIKIIRNKKSHIIYFQQYGIHSDPFARLVINRMTPLVN